MDNYPSQLKIRNIISNTYNEIKLNQNLKIENVKKS